MAAAVARLIIRFVGMLTVRTDLCGVLQIIKQGAGVTIQPNHRGSPPDDGRPVIPAKEAVAKGKN
jgi:hypothetical protein